MREPQDAKFRRMIVENLDDSILVEAGAGSGKTKSLVSRMRALIESGKCTVDRMAAVTFTRKAAAEMKSRFQIELEQALDQQKQEKEKNRLKQALENLDLLFSGTIHSFCAHLLRERPIEARLDPDFDELEEEESALLRDRCWYEYLEGLQGEGGPILGQLSELGVDPGDLIDTYRNLVLYPEVEPVCQKLEIPDFSGQREALKEYLKKASQALPESVPEKDWDDLQKLLRLAMLRTRNLDLGRNRDFIKVLSGLNRSGSITQNRWPSGEIAKEQKEKFDEFKETIVIPSLKAWHQYCHYYIMELVIPAVAYFRSYRERNSMMNFCDLLLKAAELLRGNPEIRRYFQERFTHLLVDEFQDTDPIQAEVILYLTGENVEEKEWHRIRVKPGSLFIVGDPKQSIYRFRRADIDSYNEVKRIVKQSGGLVIPLTANFRSLPAVCDWINPIFEKKFPPEGNKQQAAFERLVPFRDVKGGGLRRISIEKVYRHSQSEAAARDAERIASWLDWALRGNFRIVRTDDEISEGKDDKAQPGDFMIILRYRIHLPIYARSLEARGIPFEISGGGAFNESEEIRHLLNLLDTIAKPEDKVALIATLRGPFYGLSDDLLYRFRSEGGTFYFLTGQEGCRDNEAKKQVEAIYSELREFYHWSRTKPPGAVLNLILDSLGIVPLSLAKEMGESRAGNLLKALELSSGWNSKETLSFNEMVEQLREYYESVDVEEMSVEPGKKNAVRLMNLHKAKGLEAPVVFLADPLRDVSHDPDLHINRMGNKAVGYFVASRSKGEYATEVIGLPPDWEIYEALEKGYQDAESDRLLYVATTRAKQLLVVSSYPEKGDKGTWTSFYPSLKDVEELKAPEVARDIPLEEVINPKEFLTYQEAISEMISKSRPLSYDILTVTEKVKSPHKDLPFAQATGQGMSWGRIIHRILESLSKEEGIDLEAMAENLLKGEERPLSEKEKVTALVKGIMTSELWERMKRSQRAFSEVPFCYRETREEVPKVITGTMDLVFQETDGWVIADYKTDKIDENLEALINYYKPQVEMYREFWVKITGEKVKETGLYFIDAGKWVVV
jgi:ATP-dependent helicase/nuclease subunit A